MVDQAARVTEEQLVRYVRTFLDEYELAAEALLDSEVREQLIPYSYLPSRIIAYVSSSFGVAINYVAPSDETNVEGWSGARRAEDFLFSIPDNLRKGSALGVYIPVAATLRVQGSRFINVIPITVDNEKAEVTLINVRSDIGLVSANIRYAELYGSTHSSRWTEPQARTRALQAVKVALTDVWTAQQFSLPLTEIIRRRKENTVLVLGSFTEIGRKRLNLIRQHLIQRGYLPVLVDEYPDIEDQSLAQKVATIGLASRFVIVEDSEAAGQLFEIGAVCQANNLLTAILREKGRQASFMTRGVSVTSNIIAEYDYSASALDDSLDSSIEWAEQGVARLQKAYQSTYPWREPAAQPDLGNSTESNAGSDPPAP
jgi:hypothetical protein